jgi:hypothetical protein
MSNEEEQTETPPDVARRSIIQQMIAHALQAIGHALGEGRAEL